MTNRVIPEAAVEAAARADYGNGDKYGTWATEPNEVREMYLKGATHILEAAAPHLLSHEREETRLAHLDAMVNRETASRLERAIAGVLELAAPQRHMVSAAEIREWIATALRPTP